MFDKLNIWVEKLVQRYYWNAENRRLADILQQKIDTIAELNEDLFRSKMVNKELQNMHEKQLKHIAAYEFDWEVSETLSREERIRIYNQAFLVDGLKEMIANNVYQYKKRFIESKELDTKALYWAEVYQNFLAKMRSSHELYLKMAQPTAPTGEPDQV